MAEEDGKDKDLKREIKNDSQVTGLTVVILLSEMRKARGGMDLLGYQIQR